MKMKLPKIFLISLVAASWASDSLAQELTPRLFWPAPKGTKVLFAGYSYSEGDVLFDASIPIEAAGSKVNVGVLGYAQTLDLWGRTSNILVTLPYASGKSKGLVNGLTEKREFSAFGDLSLTLNVNIKGAPSMNAEEFHAFRADPRTLFGASIKVIAPTGKYDSDRLVNVGANRWTTRLKLGAIQPFKQHWLFELNASAWLFGDDKDFVNGRKEQQPIYSMEANLIRRIRPGLWASLDFTYYRGGRQTIGGDPLKNSLSNVKLGGTMVVPFLRRHAIKIGYANGLVTRYGEDFDQVLITYQTLLD